MEDDILRPALLDCRIFNLLRIMRNTAKKAFARLQEIMAFLKSYNIAVPISFNLDAVPQYELTEDFPFEKVMQWGEYAVLRDKNTPAGAVFDPLLLMKIPAGRYENVYKILVEHNNLNAFVMPIARYLDTVGNEYVLIHAPDDKNKCIRKVKFSGNERIQDAPGIPYTLALAMPEIKKREMSGLINGFISRKVNIEISPEDIWHLDESWKLNLF